MLEERDCCMSLVFCVRRLCHSFLRVSLENIHQQSNCHGNPRLSHILSSDWAALFHDMRATTLHRRLSPISQLNTQTDKRLQFDNIHLLEHASDVSLHLIIIPRQKTLESAVFAGSATSLDRENGLCSRKRSISSVFTFISLSNNGTRGEHN